MKKSKLVWNVFQIIEAALLISLSVVTFVLSKDQSYWTALGLAVGIGLILDSIIRITLEFVRRPVDQIKASLIAWILELGFGIFACIISDHIIPYFCLIISLMMVIIGVILFIVTVLKTVKKDTSGLHLFTGYLSSVLLIALGIVALVFYPYKPESGKETISVMLICLGVIVIILAVIELVYTIKHLVQAKNGEKKSAVSVKSSEKSAKKSPKQISEKKAQSKPKQIKEKSNKKPEVIEAEVVEEKDK